MMMNYNFMFLPIIPDTLLSTTISWSNNFYVALFETSCLEPLKNNHVNPNKNPAYAIPG